MGGIWLKRNNFSFVVLTWDDRGLRECVYRLAFGDGMGGHLVHFGDGTGVCREVDTEQVATARVAPFDANVREDGLVPEGVMVDKLALQSTHDAPTLAGRCPFFAEDWKV